MTTVPSTPRLDHFTVSLVNLSDGTATPLNEQDIIGIDWWVTKGATGPRLESGNLECPSGTEAAPSKVYSAIDWTKRQAVRITPYGDTSKEVWGLVVKYKLGYSESGRRDTLKINLAPIEYLLHSRLVYDDGEKIPGAVETADDFAKKLVRLCAVSGSAQVDPDGNSRDWNWGTLAVEADSSECGDTIPATYKEELSYLDEVLKALGVKYGFDWELKPTIGGGALTFTFNTKAPRGGTDRTSGAGRAIIQDFGSVMPAASRHFDMVDVVNAVHSASLSDAQIDATSISTYGRWEAFGPSREDTGLAIDVTQGSAKEGSSFTVALADQWMDYWDAGDLVIRANTRLGIAAANVIIEAVHATFVDKILKIEIRWGDKEATVTDKTRGGAHRPIRRVPTLIVPLAIPEFTFNAAHVEGEAFTAAPTDSVIALGIIADDADVAYPDATNSNRWTVTGANGITTSVDNVDASILTIDGTGLAPSDHDLLSATHGDTLAAGVSQGSLVIGNATPKWAELVIGADKTFLKSDGTDAAWADIAAGDMCYLQRSVTTLFQATLGDNLEVQEAGGTAILKVTPGSTYVGSDHGGPGYGSLTFTWFDFAIHDETVSGDIDSTGTGSDIHWNASGDQVNADTLVVGPGDGVSPSAESFKVDSSGNSTWVAAALMGWEGATYRMPQDAAAAGEVLTVASTGPNILEWAAGGPHAILDGTVHSDSVADAVTRGSIIYGNATPKWDELVIGAADTFLGSDGTDAAWAAVDYTQLANVPATFTPTAHDLLDGTVHGDTVADAVTRGSIIYGNATPKWDELTIGGTLTYLGSDGTDAAWTSPSNAPGAAAAILATDASGYLTLVRLQVGDAGEYLYNDGANRLYLVAASSVRYTINGTPSLAIGSTSIEPTNGTGSIDLGAGGNKFGNLHLTGDANMVNLVATGTATVTTAVVPAANDTGELGLTGTYWNKAWISNVYTGRVEVSGNILVTGTVDGVDVAALKTAYDAHDHGGATGDTAPALSGATDTYALYGSTSFGTVLRNISYTQVYYDAGGHITTSAGGNTALGTGVQAHKHNVSGGVADAAVASHGHSIAAP